MHRAALALLLLSGCPPDGAAETGATGTTSSTTSTSGTGTGTSTLDPTTGEPDGLQRCTPRCDSDADCEVDGKSIGFVCVAGVCDVPPCSDDAGCRARLSGWTTPCSAPRDCDAPNTCIDLGAGVGACALVPSRGLTCADLGLDELEVPAISGGTIVVCGDADAACADQACVSACHADSDCAPAQGTPFCDVATGACECASDRDCLLTGEPGLVACLAGRCGCAVDADCVGGTNVDVCRDGACGCSSTRVCSSTIFAEVELVCAPI